MRTYWVWDARLTSAPRSVGLSARLLDHPSDDPGAAIAHGGGVYAVVRDAMRNEILRRRVRTLRLLQASTAG
jgi:hypothetical protein